VMPDDDTSPATTTTRDLVREVLPYAHTNK
jgi:hypothetical protein